MRQELGEENTKSECAGKKPERGEKNKGKENTKLRRIQRNLV